MKFKNEIFFNKQFMETLARVNTFEDWEPKGAYWFNRLVKKLTSAQEDFNDIRKKIVDKYGETSVSLPLNIDIIFSSLCTCFK